MVFPLIAGMLAPYAIEALSSVFFGDDEEEAEEFLEEESAPAPPSTRSYVPFEEEEEEEEDEDRELLPQLPKSTPKLLAFTKPKGVGVKPKPRAVRALKGLAAARSQRRGFSRLRRR